VNVRLSLALPRDLASVPMARQIIATTLGAAGVTEECRADILLAVAEACSNAVTHAKPADGYDLTVDIDDTLCMIEVLDTGGGFDTSTLPERSSVLADSGRGLHIIRAVSDQFDIRPVAPSGTLVRFAKRLDHQPRH
jgi:serine/threonine-protein kinase RsbW